MFYKALFICTIILLCCFAVVESALAEFHVTAGLVPDDSSGTDVGSSMFISSGLVPTDSSAATVFAIDSIRPDSIAMFTREDDTILVYGNVMCDTIDSAKIDGNDVYDVVEWNPDTGWIISPYHYDCEQVELIIWNDSGSDTATLTFTTDSAVFYDDSIAEIVNWEDDSIETIAPDNPGKDTVDLFIYEGCTEKDTILNGYIYSFLRVTVIDTGVTWVNYEIYCPNCDSVIVKDSSFGAKINDDTLLAWTVDMDTISDSSFCFNSQVNYFIYAPAVDTTHDSITTKDRTHSRWVFTRTGSTSMSIPIPVTRLRSDACWSIYTGSITNDTLLCVELNGATDSNSVELTTTGRFAQHGTSGLWFAEISNAETGVYDSVLVWVEGDEIEVSDSVLLIIE